MGIIDTLCHMKLDNHDLHFNQECAEQLSDSEKWLVALSTPLSAYYGAYQDCIVSGRKQKDITSGLSDIWGINDRESYFEIVKAIVSEVRSKKYEIILSAMIKVREMHKNINAYDKIIRYFAPSTFVSKVKKEINWKEIKRITGFSDERLRKKIANINPTTDWLTDFSKDNIEMFKFSIDSIESLVAWDAVRLVSVSRYAMEVGYISREEFGEYAGKLKQKVEKNYNSWEEVFSAFIIADLILDYSESRKQEIIRTYKMMLAEENSFYRKIKFKE